MRRRIEMNMSMAERDKIQSYYVGMREGIRAYAWWKDGVQYVGTCGKTLQDAIADTLIDCEQELRRVDAEAYQNRMEHESDEMAQADGLIQ